MSSFLLITDLDNTLVGDAAALETLNQRLQYYRDRQRCVLAYSTGRSPLLYQQLVVEQNLLEPDVLILAVGTEIYWRGQTQADPQWQQLLTQQWERDAIAAISATFADLHPQPASEQRPCKISYYLSEAEATRVLPPLKTKLHQAGYAVQLIYSGGKDLDILPTAANKGQAMGYVRQRLGRSPAQTVACGDSGNDIALFADRPERGIIVGNAMPELLTWHRQNPREDCYLATAPYAAGILEGLLHFGYLADDC
jgi:sucrose-6-phosphatase